MSTLHFELVAPERVLFQGEVEAVLLPGSEGELTVLPGHAPLMTALKTGYVVMTTAANAGSRVLVRGGFAEINAEGCTVLAERATPVEELTPESLDREILEAETRRDGQDDPQARQTFDRQIAHLQEAKEALKF